MFDKNELVVIFNDQKDALDNIHFGRDDCENLYECPPDHFDMDEDIEWIFLRQSIMNKILVFNKQETCWLCGKSDPDATITVERDTPNGEKCEPKIVKVHTGCYMDMDS